VIHHDDIERRFPRRQLQTKLLLHRVEYGRESSVARRRGATGERNLHRDVVPFGVDPRRPGNLLLIVGESVSAKQEVAQNGETPDRRPPCGRCEAPKASPMQLQTPLVHAAKRANKQL
jgi:hypothetical protein